MKNKINKTMKLFSLGLMIIIFIISVNALQISEVDISEIKDTTTTITWLTDEKSTSIVYFGSGILDKMLEKKSLVTNHSILLNNLVKGTKYDFIVSSCSTNSCINSSKANFEAGVDLIPPSINATIPRFFNKNTIDIAGNVEPFSKVSLFVNELNFPIRALDNKETPEGKFKFLNVPLQKENVIKISAIDKSGNRNEVIYRLSVDTQNPVIVIDSIPSVTSKKNLTIVGTVNEPVSINFFLRFGKESIPEKIIGLTATSANDSINLEWNESKNKDFSHYIIYRDDVGPIAIADSKGYNTFTDLLVNKNVRYSYIVSQVDKFGKESELSDSAEAITRRALTNIPKPSVIDKLIIEKSTLTINTSSTFSSSLKLSKDGKYTLVIEVLDRAKNRELIEKTVTLDTKKPTIEITNPPAGTFIYENYADEMDIKGLTEPNSKVHLFVDRTPFGSLKNTGDVAGLPDSLETIPETKLDASCNLGIGTKNFCPESADYSTTADTAGNFEFENIDLTSLLSGAFSVNQVSAGSLRDNTRFEEQKDSRLFFVATDPVGLRNSKEHRVRIGTCWSGNQSWELIPLTEYQSPTFINPQRLADNKETIYFFFNYSYIGRGSEAKVQPGGVSIQRACDGTETLGEKRFNTSCQIMPPSGFSTAVNPDGTVTYTQIKLNRIEGMDRFLQNDWKNLADSINNELTFPLKVRIRYSHNVNGKQVVETQTTCQEVTYVMDNTLIDPRSVLPDWLLFDAVDFLQSSIKTINDIDKQVTKVVEYATIGCVSSFTARTGFQIFRRFDSFVEEKLFQLKNAKLIPGTELLNFEGAKSEDQEYCNAVANNIKISNKLKGTPTNLFSGIKLSHFSDADLEKCFPSVAAAWDNEAFWYNAMRFTCDRVFGHSTPSAWTESLEDEKIFQSIQEGQVCAVDKSVFGQPLRPIKCQDIATKYGQKSDSYDLSDICLERNVKRIKGSGFVTGTELYKLNNEVVPGTKNVYEVTILKRVGAETGRRYVVKETENSFFTNRPLTCEQVCKGEGSIKTGTIKFEGKDIPVYNTKTGKKGQKTYPLCTTTSACNDFKNKKDKIITLGGEDIKIKSAKQAGYTNGCFFPTESGKVSDNPETNIGCCCLNSDIKTVPAVYYFYDDLNKYGTPEGGIQNAFESKTTEGAPPKDLADMEWSYRYWKEGYVTKCKPDTKNPSGCKEGTEHNQFNPNRYIEGRDQPACFGQNNALYDGLLGTPEGGETGKLAVIDSRQQFTSAFQCVNLGGIHNRLTLINNIQNALATCLVDIRESGTSDSAACREIFTRYVCSTIWDAIQFVNSLVQGNSCTPFSASLEITDEDDYAATISDGFKSITQSISDSQSDLASEYNNVKLNNLLGTGTGEIARKICLGAFTGDWDFNIQNVIDAAYSQTMETFVQKTTGSREYLTINPTNGQAKYDYRASWVINPGCDLDNYKVELACVGRDQLMEQSSFADPASLISGGRLASRGIRCDAVGSPDGNHCDCQNKEKEELKNFFSSRGKLEQNQFIQEAKDEIITSQYRYDHLKFTLRPSRELRGADARSCFPPGHEKGVFYFPLSDKTARDVVACKVEPLTGVFSCEGATDFWSAKGFGSIQEVKINDIKAERNKETVILKGGELKIQPTVLKSPGSPNKCLVAQIDKQGAFTPPQAMMIDRDGTIQYPEVILDSNVQPSRNTRSMPSPRYEDGGCEDTDNKACGTRKFSQLGIEKINRNNNINVDITLRFIDNNDNGEIELTDSSKDLMEVNGISNILGRGGWWKDLNNGPVVSVSGVKYKVTKVPFGDNIKSITYTQKIPKATEEGSDDRWTLRLGLYEADDFGSCSTYNKGELLKYNGVDQEFHYKIRVRAKSDVLNAPKLTLAFNQVDGKTKNFLNPGEDKVILKVEIYDETGVDDDLVYKITKPGQSTDQDDQKCSVLSTDKPGQTRVCNLEFNHNNLGVDNSRTGGTYKIKLEARDTDTISHTTTEEIAIEVRCGTSQYERGLCVSPANCNREDRINEDITCQENFICCPTNTIG